MISNRTRLNNTSCVRPRGRGHGGVHVCSGPRAGGRRGEAVPGHADLDRGGPLLQTPGYWKPYPMSEPRYLDISSVVLSVFCGPAPTVGHGSHSGGGVAGGGAGDQFPVETVLKYSCFPGQTTCHVCHVYPRYIISRLPDRGLRSRQVFRSQQHGAVVRPRPLLPA